MYNACILIFILGGGGYTWHISHVILYEFMSTYVLITGEFMNNAVQDDLGLPLICESVDVDDY